MPTLPGTIAPNGARIIIGRPGIRNPQTSTVDEMIRAFYVMLDVVTHDDEIINVTGVNMVLDVQGLSFSHVAQMTPAVIKKMSTIIQVIKCRHFQMSNITCAVSIYKILAATFRSLPLVSVIYSI